MATYERLRNETKVSAEKTTTGWRVTVTRPQLDRELFAGTLDLVWPGGKITTFNPFEESEITGP